MKPTNQSNKHVPLRMCTICRQQFHKAKLIRMVAQPEGVVVDPRGKLSGRGLYVCTSADCQEKLLKQHRIEQQMKCALTDEDRSNIRSAIELQSQVIQSKEASVSAVQTVDSDNGAQLDRISDSVIQTATGEQIRRIRTRKG